ncbi:MAG: N-acetylmuramoyl-L-alanine amidase [Patescibacteria group bacterium]
MRRLVLILLCIIPCLSPVAGAGAAEVRAVTVDGTPRPDLKAALFDGHPYLALSSLSVLHAVAAWDRARAVAAVGIARRTLFMTAGSAVMALDGRQAEERLAPVMAGGEFWLPAEWLRHFRIKASWDADAGSLALTWAANFLLSATLDKAGVAPRLVIETAGPLKATVFHLANPARLVVDLPGVEPYDYLALDDRENEYFYRLRVGLNRPGVERLVVDLLQPVGYKVDASRAREGRLVLDLDTLVEGIAVVPADEGRKVTVTANHKPEWTAAAYANPDRIVIELKHAALAVPAGTLPGDGDWIKSVSSRALAGGRVQVVVTLARQLECEIAAARGNERVIEVQPLQRLARLAWREQADGFDLASTGVLALASAVEHYPERMILRIHHAAGTPEEGYPSIGAVSHYRVRQVEAGVVEIALDLRYEAAPRIEFSQDRRRAAIRFPPSPLGGRTIVLDPGHGGEDAGAMGRTALVMPDGTKTTLREKDINLDVACQLKELLENAGAFVYLTRVGDTSVPLFARASFANQVSADLFASIHTNAHDDPAVNGVEIFYHPSRQEDRRLASLVLEDMTAALGLYPRGAKANDFAVLRECVVPSVLVELGFLTNKAEEAGLARAEFRKKAALAIFRALLRFFRGDAAAAVQAGP